jgi:hypothetical protein
MLMEKENLLIKSLLFENFHLKEVFEDEFHIHHLIVKYFIEYMFHLLEDLRIIQLFDFHLKILVLMKIMLDLLFDI